MLSAAELVLEHVSNGQGVCARVSIEIDQRIAITRSAFRATLDLSNPGGSGVVDAVTVILSITDVQGGASTGLFLIEEPELEGISDVSGGGSLPEGSSGRASWRIIPSDLAAPTEDTPYFVTGEFQYRVNGSLITVPLAPAQILVRPNASLDLKYFVERDVYADDPFTEPVEPSIPYSLGLLMSNQGAGEARDVRIAAAEPRIVENDRGLVIDFDLIGTQVNRDPVSPSLNVNLGNLAQGNEAVARWLFLSSLQGEFTSFSAEFVSLNGFNTPEFSLIDSIDIFELDHIVRAGAYQGMTGGVDDELFDFLTNETPDLSNLPDRLHQSDGAVDPVTARDGIFATILPDGRTATIDATMGSGWTYLRVQDPFDAGLALQSVERSDGKVLLNSFNTWQTSRIARRGPNEGQPERYVHIFDRGGDGRYTLHFSGDTEAPEVLSWESLGAHGSLGDIAILIASDGSTTEPRNSGISNIRITFNEPISPESFEPINAVVRGLAASGQEIDLSNVAIQTELSTDGLSGIVRFNPALPNLGKYCITLNGVRDVAGNVLTVNARTVITAIKGDISADRRVNATDVAFVRDLRAQTAGGLINPSESVQVRADVTGDGRVNASDLAFVRASVGGDVRAIGDPCFIPDLSAGLAQGGVTAADQLASARGNDGADAGPSSDSNDPDELLEDGESSWRQVDAAFTAPGVVIRVDPRRFALQTEGQPVDPVTLLLDSGVAIEALSTLGIDGWTVVDGLTEARAEELRSMLAASGIYTAPALRDEAGEILIAQRELLVRFDAAIPENWRSQVIQANVPGVVAVEEKLAGLPGVISVTMSSLRGEEVMAIASTLAARRDIEMVEPNFIMLGRRAPITDLQRTRSELASLLDAKTLNRAALDVIDIAIVDDTALQSEQVQDPASLDAVSAASLELPVTLHGQRIEDAAVLAALALRDAGVSTTTPRVIHFQGFTQAHDPARAPTTLRALASAFTLAGASEPRIIATSTACGYRSRFIDYATAQATQDGCLLITPASTGSPETSSLPNADRIGGAAAALLAVPSISHPESPVTHRTLIAEALRSAEASPIEIYSSLRRTALDFDSSGTLDAADLAAFLQAYAEGHLSADADGDGEVNTHDMTLLLQAIESPVSP